jgi:hypothetical protein
MTWKETGTAAADTLRELPKKTQRDAERQFPNQTWLANATAIGWIETLTMSDKGWAEWEKFCEEMGLPVGERPTA